VERNEAFPVLSSLSVIMGNVGWVLLIAGGVAVCIGIVLLVMDVDGVNIFKVIFVLAGIVAGITGMIMVVLGEMVGVFFAIEHNGAQLLQLERLNERNRLITGEGEAT